MSKKEIICDSCKPKTLPLFPIWDNKAKYWHKDKKEQKIRELCCELNGKD